MGRGLDLGLDTMVMAMAGRRVVVAMVRSLPRQAWSRLLVRRRMTTTAPDPVPVAAVVVIVVAPLRETMTTTAMADHAPAAPDDGARASLITSTRACQLWVLKRTKSATGTLGIVDDTVVTTTTDLPAPMMIAILVLPVVVVMIPDGGMIGVRDGVMGVGMRER